MAMISTLIHWLLLGNKKVTFHVKLQMDGWIPALVVVGLLQPCRISSGVGHVKCVDMGLIVEKSLLSGCNIFFIKKCPVAGFFFFSLIVWNMWFGAAMLKSEALSIAPHSLHMSSDCQPLAAGQKKGNFYCFQLLKMGNSHETDGAVIPLCKLGEKLWICSDRAIIFS